MNASTRTNGRTLWVATRSLLLFTVLLGLGYTLIITGIGQVVMPYQSGGSVIRNGAGEVVGSELIGQSYLDAEGNPLPTFFQPRPSAAGDDGYAGDNSAGSNQGPENEELTAAIAERRGQVAEFNGVPPEQVPVDAVTASASGLDPQISPEYARLQVNRVAEARGLPAKQVRALVEKSVRPASLGYLGMPTVNVLQLNLALEGLQG